MPVPPAVDVSVAPEHGDRARVHGIAALLGRGARRGHLDASIPASSKASRSSHSPIGERQMLPVQTTRPYAVVRWPGSLSAPGEPEQGEGQDDDGRGIRVHQRRPSAQAAVSSARSRIRAAVVPSPAGTESGLRRLTLRERHERAGGGDRTGVAHGGAVGERLDEQPHLAQRLGRADRVGHGVVQDGEVLDEQVVPPAQVGPLVREDRVELVAGSAARAPWVRTTRDRRPGRQ